MLHTAQRSMGDFVNQFFSQVLGLVLKIFLAVLAVVFAVSMLAAGLIYLVFASIRFLLTGRKPAVAVLFSQMQQFRQSAADGVWPATRRKAPVPQPRTADVVDVEVREINEARSHTDNPRQP